MIGNHPDYFMCSANYLDQGFAGSLLVNAVTAAQGQSLEQYANAGAIATEALGEMI